MKDHLGLALAAVIALIPTTASADGETTPMFGGAVVGGTDHSAGLAGAEIDSVWWHWRFGFSAQGSMLWSTDGDSRRVAVLGLSARVLAFDTLVESLIDPAEVELGIEAHGIIERAWWTGSESATRFGLGLAVRLRGDSEYDLSTMIAESRLFVRVMASPGVPGPVVARMTGAATPTMDHDTGVLFIIGLGASFGKGEPGYLDRFRVRAFSPAARRMTRSWFQ